MKIIQHKMTTFKGVAWNCGGLRSSSSQASSKSLYFEKTFQTDFDIAFFLETHHKEEGEIPPEILRYSNTHHILHSPAAQDESHAGIIALVNQTYEIVNNNSLIQGRILNILIKDKSTGTLFNISGVYLDTNDKLNKTKIQTIVSKLQQAHENDPNSMIMGDFNFIDNEKDKTRGLREQDKLASRSWIPFLDKNDFIDPYREQNPKRRIWSFIGTGRAGNSRIDRLYTHSTKLANLSNMQYTPTPFGGHRVFSFTHRSHTEKGKSYYKLNTSILRDSQYKTIVTDTVKEIQSLNETDPITKWGSFLSTIKAKSRLYSKRKGQIKRLLKTKLTKQIMKKRW